MLKKVLRSNHKRKIPLILGAILLVAVLMTLLELSNTTHLFPKDTTPISAGPITKGEPSHPNIKSSNKPATIQQKVDTKQSTDKAVEGALLVPTGNFVSNHHPNLSGSPAPNTMTSVCNTSPGAQCSIVFTKDGLVKTLPSETADAGGSAYWGWKLQDIGLTEGTWSIKAVAVLNGDTKTAADTMDLVVQP